MHSLVGLMVEPDLDAKIKCFIIKYILDFLCLWEFGCVIPVDFCDI